MSGAPIPAGDIRFYDGYKPLGAGDYTLTATQVVTSTDAAHPLSQTTTATQAFSVAAPRFALDPTEVQSMYPPANASGPYGAILPHVVLTERALPWERALADNYPHPANPNAPAYPWLALLLFADGELIAPAGGPASNPTLVSARTVADFQASAAPILPLGLEPQREDEANCHTIDVATATFAQIAPRVADLPWLAHVRQVDVTDKAGTVAAGSGWFSVVIANRFPQAGTAYVAHLVSLEGMADYLVAEPAWPNGVTTVRLASLASWTFTCQAEGADFTALMTNLRAGESPGGDGLRLRLPVPEGAPAGDAVSALSQGYAALGYETRAGDRSFAWYHGPLVPHPVPPIAAGTAFRSSGAAAIYDPVSGTFDHSYSACWETGRLMALRDRAYATAQQRLRATLRRTVNLVRERGVPEAALAPKAVSRAFAGWLGGEAAAAVPIPGGAAALPRPRSRGESAGPAVEQLQSLLASHGAAALVGEQVTAAAAEQGPAQSVADWLANLLLLQGVPFVHLVPDARMLPSESIRFFYVDPNALDALCAGAQSVGVQTSRDAAQDALARPAILQAALAKAGTRRLALTGRLGATDAPAVAPVAGFLLRSAVVSGWPGLEVKAWADAAGTQPILPLRLDHLAGEVMIGLYPQVPARIDIEEPKEALAFGVEDEWAVDLRYLSGASVGQQITSASVTLDPSFRPGGVLQVDAWQQHLIALPQLAPDAAIWGPAGFALQMISAPEQAIFHNGAAA
jgi:hypothetical protein